MTPNFFLENDDTVPVGEMYEFIGNTIQNTVQDIPEIQQKYGTMDWTPLYTLANWAAWIGLVLFVVSLIILFAKMGSARNSVSGVVSEEVSTGLKAIVVGAFLITMQILNEWKYPFLDGAVHFSCREITEYAPF